MKDFFLNRRIIKYKIFFFKKENIPMDMQKNLCHTRNVTSLGNKII